MFFYLLVYLLFIQFVNGHIVYLIVERKTVLVDKCVTELFLWGNAGESVFGASPDRRRYGSVCFCQSTAQA